MFRKTLTSLIALLSFLCLLAPPALAQDESETAEAVTMDGTEFIVNLEPHEIPQFTVVEWLFRRLSMVRASAYVYENILKEIGIEPGSYAAEFLAGVTDQAMEVLNVHTVNGKLTGEAFMEYQYQAIGEKARKLGVVYRNLVLGLEEAGVSLELIERYCEEELRPSLQIASTISDNTKYMEAVAEFDKQLENRR